MPTAPQLPMQTVGQGFIQTTEIGGSRFATWGKSAFNPAGMVGSTTVTGLATLSVPPTYNTMSAAGPLGMGSSASANAAANPFSPKDSPLPWVILFLILSVWGVKRLYFDDKRR